MIHKTKVTEDLVYVWVRRGKLVVRDHYYVAKLLKKTFSGKVGISHWISRQMISNKFVRTKMRPKVGTKIEL